MSKQKMDFSSRIAFRPVIAGTLITLALTLFLSNTVREMLHIAGRDADDTAFGVWFSMASVWGFSVLCGAIVATLGARAQGTLDAILNALTVWALSFLCFGALIAARNVGFEAIVELEDISGFWVVRDFLGELIALSFSVFGSILAVKWREIVTLRFVRREQFKAGSAAYEY